MMIRVSVSVSPLIPVDGAEGGKTTIRHRKNDGFPASAFHEDSGSLTALAPVPSPAPVCRVSPDGPLPCGATSHRT